MLFRYIMNFKRETIVSVIKEMGHIGQVCHLGYDMDGDEVFNSLTLFGVTIKIDKDELINKLKEKEPADEWRGVSVEEPEVEPEVVDEDDDSQHGEVEDKE